MFRDADLVERLCQREPEALAEAYDGYAAWLYALLLRMTHDEQTAEDLVQEVFLRLWNRAVLFDGRKGTLGGWLASVARNLATDKARSASSRFAKHCQPLEDSEGSGRYGSCEDTEWMMIRTLLVKSALSKLTEQEKQVLQLAYFDGRSQSEIAILLNRPLGTVKNWTVCTPPFTTGIE